LKKRGLDVNGKKVDLVARLEAGGDGGAQSAAAAATPLPAETEDEIDGQIGDDDDLQKIYEQIKENKRVNTPKTTPRNDVEDDDLSLTDEQLLIKEEGIEIFSVGSGGEETLIPMFTRPGTQVKSTPFSSEPGLDNGYTAIEESNGAPTREEQLEKMRKSRVANRVEDEEVKYEEVELFSRTMV